MICVVQQFGGEAMVNIGYGKEGLFFAGKQPTYPSLVTLEMPGLKRVGNAIRLWLIAHHRRRGGKSRRQRVDLVESLWRPTVLDDFIDAHNAEACVWYVSTYFTARQISDFTAKHGPSLHHAVREAIEVERTRRARALKAVAARTNRVVPVIYQGSRRLYTEMEAIKEELDREDAAELLTSPFSVARWIKGTSKLRTPTVKAQVLGDFGKQLAERPHLIAGALDRMIAAKLHEVHAPEMWKHIATLVPIEQTIRGKTIDLTTAHEMTAELGWELWSAERVGPVKPNRSVLAVTVGKRTYYVRGERKLKHAIRARGGKITRWGCTLVVGGSVGTRGVHAKLLEVDRIDTLAHIDPRRAVALVSGDDPAIATAARHADDDPRWRRILADLLIERLVGIDADVARRLARSHASANRRR
ncbi:MAG TPA: hypothetical protein VGO00_09000 [Kofleriaceae bacterium]|jgi:hypothetical protein|nr:hypothetical protein [Kofleriaceae bacterium]